MMLLITGATGFVASHLIPRLLQGGYELRCLVRKNSRADALRALGVELATGDITDPQSLAHPLEGIHTVVHLVGIIKEVKGATFQSIHVQGTKNLLAAAKSAGVARFLYISALGTGPDAVSRYSQTKWQAEEAVRNSGLQYLILRPSVLCGEGSEFVALFADVIRKLPFLALPATSARFQPIFVGDLASCILKALQDDSLWNDTFELAGPAPLTLAEIVQAIMQHLGRRRPILNIPLPLMRSVAWLLEHILPDPPLTRDQLLNLQQDNTCDIARMKSTFAISPMPFRDALATYLKRP